MSHAQALHASMVFWAKSGKVFLSVLLCLHGALDLGYTRQITDIGLVSLAEACQNALSFSTAWLA